MEITPAQFSTIDHCLPKQRGNVSLSNLQVVNAILYVAEHGCKWRGLLQRLGLGRDGKARPETQQIQLKNASEVRVILEGMAKSYD